MENEPGGEYTKHLTLGYLPRKRSPSVTDTPPPKEWPVKQTLWMVCLMYVENQRLSQNLYQILKISKNLRNIIFIVLEVEAEN